MEVSIIDPTLGGLPLPGKCYYCGGATKEKYLDTGIQIEFYGALIICEECMSFLASKMNYITPNIADELKVDNEALKLELADQKLKFMALEQALNSLKVSGHLDDVNRDNFISLDSISGLDFSQDSDASVEAIQRGEEGMENREGNSVEPSDEQGLADVPAINSQSDSLNWK
jgi:hypothetical protein